ncbi:MAG: cytochrome b N-terminal domain-containing protein [Candidatus Omnitrophica bacterium]|nr:cytochrome b N-terminal domain-containing protein [Candidatus Omnitrophota bacterium]
MSERKTRFQRLTDFLSDRLPLHKLSFENMVTKKEVPVHGMSWAYYMGGLTLLFFLIQLVTGVFLLFYYQPTVSDAHASVEYITFFVNSGFLIRNLHTWSSSCMIFCLLVHVLTAFAMKGFARPREITWWSGSLLLILTFSFGFTGYLLPWHQIAVNATKVVLQSIEEVGRYLPGGFANLPTYIKELIQGEASVGQATLSRFYALHVVILPLIFFATLGLHLLSVQLHGISQGIDNPSKKTERFFPFFILKDFWLWGLAFLVVFILALCLPFESFYSYPLFEAFDSLGSTPDGIKPEWYFYFVYYPLEILPFWIVMLGMTFAGAGLFLTPSIFKHTSRKVLSIIASVAAAYLIIITFFGQAIYEAFKGVSG